ncbi:MAG: 30S ribosome-binding factor RbfA [Candidatus Eiseniibacteriota bacterium]
MRSTRMRRTDDLVRKVISEALLTKVQDPRIGMVSVTGVRISRELDTAKVWVTVLGDEAARTETMKGLRSAASFLQSEIARQVRMRKVPRLSFVYDDSLDEGMRISAALRDVETERASREDGPAGEEESDEAQDR